MSDYISREAALTELCKRSKATFSLTGNPILDVNYVEAIKAIPAADVRPVVRGKWIAYQQGRWVYAKCPECETVHDVKSNYCPNCGADMREES